LERLEKTPNIDAARIAEAIEMTRFPVPQDAKGASESLEPKLVQAADFIGQLGDPLDARKANALYYEFQEIGMNRQLGYSIIFYARRAPSGGWGRRAEQALHDHKPASVVYRHLSRLMTARGQRVAGKTFLRCEQTGHRADKRRRRAMPVELRSSLENTVFLKSREHRA
jgi:hypothetical protein